MNESSVFFFWLNKRQISQSACELGNDWQLCLELYGEARALQNSPGESLNISCYTRTLRVAHLASPSSYMSACPPMLNMNDSSWALHKAGDGVSSGRPEVKKGLSFNGGVNKSSTDRGVSAGQSAHSSSQMSGLEAWSAYANHPGHYNRTMVQHKQSRMQCK